MSAAVLSRKPDLPGLAPDRFVDIDLFGQDMKANAPAYFADWVTKPPFYAMVQGHAHVVICQHEQVQWALKSPHLCPGNALARMATRAIVGRLIFGFPELRLTDPAETIVYGGMPTERFPTHVNLRVD